MTPRELTIAQLGHGPADVPMVSALLMSHGHGYPDAVRLAKESLAALVVEKRAELLRVGNADVYRISATTPVEKSTEPAPKARGVRR
jgi:hypothetical protein